MRSAADGPLNPPGPAAVAFRLAPAALERAQSLFNERAEVRWFGFRGRFDNGAAFITFDQLHSGLRGGGGSAALNGGVIAAGFDAAAVMTGLGHYETDTVVTVDLQVQFLALAQAGPDLAWRGWATRTTRGLCFVQAVLGDAGRAFASASAVVKPA